MNRFSLIATPKDFKKDLNKSIEIEDLIQIVFFTCPNTSGIFFE